MKITVLDGHSLNPGDLSWDELAKLGDLNVYDFTQPGLVIERALDSEIVFTNKTKISMQVIDALPKLRFIGVLATGFDVIDIASAKLKGVLVANVPSYGTDSVAQMVIAHLLNITNQVEAHACGVSSGKWSKSCDFCYWEKPMMELTGKTLGIIGFGRIGQRVAAIAQALGMNVIAHDSIGCGGDGCTAMVDLVTLFQTSDVISLHCPLTNITRNLINENSLKMMKKNTILLNTSRGQLIDNSALAKALKDRTIMYAGIDVLDQEPPMENHPLLNIENCRITPHIAWATLEARKRLMATAIENLKKFLAGTPINIVN